MQRQSPPRLNPRFLELARDPRIVPGLHRACDEWCDYCPLTDRCLLFQCTREFQRQRRRASTSGFRTAAEAMEFARDFALVDVASAERTAAQARTAARPEPTDDDAVVAAVALEYARRSREFATSAPPTVRLRGHRREPPPVDTILRFHTRIYFKTMRALVGYQLTAAGLAHRCADAKTCAGQTLAYADRSRAALMHFQDSDERRALAAQLDTIARAIEVRFPDAGAIIRSRTKISAA